MKRIIFTTLAAILIHAHAFAADCSQVISELRGSETWDQAMNNYKSKAIQIRQLVSRGDWYIAEFESADFEPVIAVFSKSFDRYEGKAEWGGMPEEGDTLVEFFSAKAKGAPADLFFVSRPKGQPFVTE